MAIGQAFFSISVAMGLMMVYGAYLPKDISIPRSATTIVLADTGVALLAGFAIFPLVFAFLTSVAPEGVAVMTDITHYLDFVLTLFFAFIVFALIGNWSYFVTYIGVFALVVAVLGILKKAGATVKPRITPVRIIRPAVICTWRWIGIGILRFTTVVKPAFFQPARPFSN